jgi:hypothetical protein
MSGRFLSNESWDDACLMQMFPVMTDYCCALRIGRIWAFDNEDKSANVDYIRTGRHVLSDPCGVTSRSGTFAFEKAPLAGRLYLCIS